MKFSWPFAKLVSYFVLLKYQYKCVSAGRYTGIIIYLQYVKETGSTVQ